FSRQLTSANIRAFVFRIDIGHYRIISGGDVMLIGSPNRRQFIYSTSLFLSVAAVAPKALAQPLKPQLNFLVVGDWGRDGKKHQSEVAGRMGQTAATMGARFVVSTGDNFYTLGVRSVDDSKWGTSFQ